MMVTIKEGQTMHNKRFGISLLREREHMVMIRENVDGSKMSLTLPNHSQIKGSICENYLQAGISSEDFLNAYQNAYGHQALFLKCHSATFTIHDGEDF